jgi:ribose 5-phosphate isomerase B
VNIALGSDHAGHQLRLVVADHLKSKGIVVQDLGVDSDESVDYPVYARKVCKALQDGQVSLGVLVCGSGQGMAISANKHKGIRAALCTSEELAKLAKEHNDANILCLGERIVEQEMALRIVDTFLESEFLGGRHAKRVKLIES